jgi:hypothetical protein
VLQVRPPLEANVPVSTDATERLTWPRVATFDGEEIVKTNADQWHGEGVTGAGVKVGIVDYFHTGYAAARAAGEVPAPAGTICRNNGANCSAQMFSSFSDHGTGVAEIVHEMAPSAQLYLATVNTTADLQAAVNYFDAQGVHIITRSLTSEYDGPGNGSGPIAEVISNAVSRGMAWFNSAGNSAGRGARNGSYYRSLWKDADSDGFMDFNGPGNEYLYFACNGFMNGLRWDDWAVAGRTDYDVDVYNVDGDVIGSSARDQRDRDGGRAPASS